MTKDADAELEPDLVAEKLTRSRVLSGCGRLALARLLPFVSERRLQAGEPLCRAGDAADHMWLVLRGTLRLERADASPHHISDGLVGEEAALGITHYLSDVVAVDASTVVALPRHVIPRELGAHDTPAQAFCRSLIRAFAPNSFPHTRAEAGGERLSAGALLWKVCGWLLAVIAPLLMLQLTAEAGLRWEQQQLASVLTSACVLWVFAVVPPYVAGLLVVLVCVTLGIVPNGVILSGFASNGFFLALSMFCLGTVLIESGAITRGFLLLLRRCPSSALAYDAAVFLSGFALTPVVSAVPERARVMAPLAAEAAQTLGYGAGSVGRTRLAIAAFFGITVFSPMFLTGAALNLMLYGQLSEQVQDAIPGLRWLLAAAPAAVVVALGFAAAYWLMLRDRHAPRLSVKAIDAQLGVLGRVRPTEWLAVGGVLLFLGAVATVSAHKVDHRLLALSIVCGFLLLGILGKTQLNFHIDWSVLILLGAVIGVNATMTDVQLDSVAADRAAWLVDMVQHQPYLFIALLSIVVVVAGLWIPMAGALVGLFAVPLAVFAGMTPWVVVFVILLMSDVSLRPKQSRLYRDFIDTLQMDGAIDERRFARFHAAMAVTRVVALLVSLPYWQALRML